eukprot:scaffold167249_cov36-Tisochrysis_lutea.AAC.1
MSRAQLLPHCVKYRFHVPIRTAGKVLECPPPSLLIVVGSFARGLAHETKGHRWVRPPRGGHRGSGTPEPALTFSLFLFCLFPYERRGPLPIAAAATQGGTYIGVVGVSTLSCLVSESQMHPSKSVPRASRLACPASFARGWPQRIWAVSSASLEVYGLRAKMSACYHPVTTKALCRTLGWWCGGGWWLGFTMLLTLSHVHSLASYYGGNGNGNGQAAGSRRRRRE